ncbi:aspartate-semialdehyde dehydrogenase [Candidatus Foliamicus sp.]
MDGYNVAVAGATGLVGETLLRILAERKFPVKAVHALASEKSLGKTVEFADRQVPVEVLGDFDFSQSDIALFSAGADAAREHAPRAASQGTIVIDNSSAFRYDDDVPLVVPEVNPESLAGSLGRRLVANPNCSTIQLVVALKPLYDAAGIERISVATYQAISGAGRQAMEELARHTADMMSGKGRPEGAAPEAGDAEQNGEQASFGTAAPSAAFNAVPHIDVFQDNGYTKEEMKIVWETRKILGDPTLRISATAVRVPVFFGHSEAVSVELKREIEVEEALALFRGARGVIVKSQGQAGGYPTAGIDAAQSDAVFVGRVRQDISHEQGLNFWVVADNVRKGAALNAVQIAELLIRDHLPS